MRLKRHFNALLVERNVINVDAIEEFVKEIIDAKNPPRPVTKWLQTAVRKWLINETPNARKIKRTSKGGWAQDALDRGEDIYEIELSYVLQDQISHAVDWIIAENVRTARLSVWDAFKGAIKWTEKLKRQKLEGSKGAVELVAKLNDGYTLVKLADDEACSWEGSKMGHCVGQGNYSPGKYNDDSGIYSIRDRSGKPHVTLERNGGYFTQIQGKGNNPPAPKHMRAVAKVLNMENFKDGINKGLAQHLNLVKARNGRWLPFDDLPAGSSIAQDIEVKGKYEDFTLPQDVKINGVFGMYDKSTITLEKGGKFTSVFLTAVKTITCDGMDARDKVTLRNAESYVTNSKTKLLEYMFCKRASLAKSDIEYVEVSEGDQPTNVDITSSDVSRLKIFSANTIVIKDMNSNGNSCDTEIDHTNRLRIEGRTSIDELKLFGIKDLKIGKGCVIGSLIIDDVKKVDVGSAHVNTLVFESQMVPDVRITGDEVSFTGCVIDGRIELVNAGRVTIDPYNVVRDKALVAGTCDELTILTPHNNKQPIRIDKRLASRISPDTKPENYELV